MNWMLIPTLLCAGLLFGIGLMVARSLFDGKKSAVLFAIASAAAAPGIIFAVYNLKIFNEPIWLYRWRALPFSELSASGVGFLMGCLHERFAGKLKLSRVGKKILFPVLLLMIISIPYLKPIFRPMKASQFHERWSDGVCLQSSDSTCGPASAATLLQARGRNVTERQMATEAFTSNSGTENWYLNRSLRKHGVVVEYRKTEPQPSSLYFPAIAGVRLLDQNGPGHFIAVLDRQGADYVIGDPLVGKVKMTVKQLQAEYYFTGFFMLMK
jgi:hypothetical protein